VRFFPLALDWHNRPRTFASKSTDFCLKVHGLLYQSPRTFALKSTDFRIKVHGLSHQSPRTFAQSIAISLEIHCNQFYSTQPTVHHGTGQRILVS